MIQNDRSHKVTARMALFACVAPANTVDPFSNSHDDSVRALETPRHVTQTRQGRAGRRQVHRAFVRC
jgi:hypothetical protein